jgi:hypothetical protein
MKQQRNKSWLEVFKEGIIGNSKGGWVAHYSNPENERKLDILNNMLILTIFMVGLGIIILTTYLLKTYVGYYSDSIFMIGVIIFLFWYIKESIILG